MLSKPSIIIACSITLLLFTGCTTQSTLDTHWGSSFQESKINQTANPEASKNLDPVVGLDGQFAEGNMQSYRQGCDGTGTATDVNLNLGSIGTIGNK